MKETRVEKGITLIALIITIVVLLILATVAISSIQNDGILGYAENVAKDYNQAVKNEQDILKEYEGYFTPYTVGQEVTIEVEGVEHEFYVIKDNGTTVSLLAKKCIIADKTNANYLTQSSSAGTVVFSSDNYWKNESSSVRSDLNKCTIPEGVTSIITTAKEYGEQFGVTTGRLLTYSEANKLDDHNSVMIYGDSTNGYLDYWLGSASDASRVWFCRRQRRILWRPHL